jgi:hypothetical protein
MNIAKESESQVSENAIQLLYHFLLGFDKDVEVN